MAKGQCQQTEEPWLSSELRGGLQEGRRPPAGNADGLVIIPDENTGHTLQC